MRKGRQSRLRDAAEQDRDVRASGVVLRSLRSLRTTPELQSPRRDVYAGDPGPRSVQFSVAIDTQCEIGSGVAGD